LRETDKQIYQTGQNILARASKHPLLL